MATIAIEGLLTFARLNLVAAAAIALVLLFRPLVRRWFDSHQPYLSWLIVPVALVGAIIPAQEGSGPLGGLEAAIGDAHGWLTAGSNVWVLAVSQPWASPMAASSPPTGPEPSCAGMIAPTSATGTISQDR